MTTDAALTALPTSRVPDPADAPPLRWGILSTGGIAASMTDALLKHTSQRVVAIGSRSPESARAFADRFGIDRAHGSMEAMLADDEIDVVYIASPHSEHHRQAMAAMAAGKNVLVEKAFARNAGEAAEMVAAARAAGVTAMEAMWARFLPQADILRQLLADGALGEVVTVIADHGQYFAPDPEFRLFNPDLAGGALLDLGIYPVSFASMVLGAPTAVTARGSKAFTGVDGQVSLLLEAGDLAGGAAGDAAGGAAGDAAGDAAGEAAGDAGRDARGGAQALVNTTLFAATPTTATVSGTVARVEISGPFYAPGTLTYLHRDGSRLEFDGGPIRGHEALAYEAAHLAQLISDGHLESPIMPLDETMSIMTTLDEARRQLGVVLPGE
ncbi:Gfo/Idh/MocA family protein [Nakamurella lactea]|uniref:Gfo/Idh/MocA family protein n=1 Tax=Nakamurella lactea TaxID=459515 RepID=UPI000407B489|nr:Gfo/Idh/MocA family oxidoreductase [Nakamurella lactea]